MVHSARQREGKRSRYQIRSVDVECQGPPLNIPSHRAGLLDPVQYAPAVVVDDTTFSVPESTYAEKGDL